MDINTDSYPKLPATPPNFLDTAQKYGNLQQQQQQIQSGAITIDQQKFNLIKDRWDAIAGQMPGLIGDKNLTEYKVRQFYQSNVNRGLMTPDMAATATSEIPPTAGMPKDQAVLTLQNHVGQKMQQGMHIMDALEYHVPKPTTLDTGNQQVPVQVQRKPMAGLPNGGITQLQPGIPTQPPPTQPTVSQGGQGQPPRGTPGILGPSAPATGLPSAPGVGAGSIFPFKPGTPPPQIQGMGGVPTAAAPKPVATQSFTPTGNSPLFEAGKTQYSQDQQTAAAKSQAMIPALQALPLMKDIMSGPGTAGFTHALAGLKAFGIIPTDVNDPVVARQEVVKKLNAYVSSNPVGQRSDAAQTLAEASSPSPNVQNIQALVNLTKDAIAQDRTTISKPGAFANDDFAKYGQHTTTYPTQIDQRAMQIDQMDPGQRQSLLDNMKKKANTAEGKKFWKTLSIVKQQGLFNVTNGE